MSGERRRNTCILWEVCYLNCRLEWKLQYYWTCSVSDANKHYERMSVHDYNLLIIVFLNNMWVV